MTDAEWSDVLILCESCATRTKARHLRDEADAGSVCICYDGCGIETIVGYYTPPDWPTSFPPSETRNRICFDRTKAIHED